MQDWLRSQQGLECQYRVRRKLRQSDAECASAMGTSAGGGRLTSTLHSRATPSLSRCGTSEAGSLSLGNTGKPHLSDGPKPNYRSSTPSFNYFGTVRVFMDVFRKALTGDGGRTFSAASSAASCKGGPLLDAMTSAPHGWLPPTPGKTRRT